MERKQTLTTVNSKWETSIKEIFPHFKVDEDNDGTIKMIKLWLLRDERFETLHPEKNYCLNKGIILHGNYGTGKTKLMQVVQRTAYLLQSPLQFKRFNMRELCQKYQSEGGTVLNPDNKHWFVDEFGLVKEDDPRERVNSYGNKVLLGDELIGVRYDRFQMGFLTHMTTNLTYQQMNDYYSPRTISRLHEMCNFLPLDGKDRRLTAKPQPPVQPTYERKIDKKKAAQDWWEMIKREQVAYKNGGCITIIGALTQFRMFEDAGLIIMTKAVKMDWIAKAKKLIKGKKEEANEQAEKERQRLTPVDMLQFKKIKVLREAMEKGLLTGDQENEIRSLAAGMAMQDFYNSKTEEEFGKLIDAIIEKI